MAAVVATHQQSPLETPLPTRASGHFVTTRRVSQNGGPRALSHKMADPREATILGNDVKRTVSQLRLVECSRHVLILLTYCEFG